MDQTGMGVTLDGVAHIISMALTPVFLLSAIASLLNVITGRLGRVADQAEAVMGLLRGAGPDDLARLPRRLDRLRRRLEVLDIARASGAVAGVLICAATFTLFLGALRNTAAATALFLLFGASVLCTMAAIVAFFVEVLMSGHRDLRISLPE